MSTTVSESSDPSPVAYLKVIEGRLQKYTNLVKGWQFRWFVLDQKLGLLKYYLSESEKGLETCRGGMGLYNASIELTTGEDSCCGFVVTSESGEVFKLRASGEQERDMWVSRIKETISRQESNVKVYKKMLRRGSSFGRLKKKSTSSEVGTMLPGGVLLPSAVSMSLLNVQQRLSTVLSINSQLSEAISCLPISSPSNVTHCDPTLLQIKAIAHSLALSLTDCYDILSENAMAQYNRPSVS